MVAQRRSPLGRTAAGLGSMLLLAGCTAGTTTPQALPTARPLPSPTETVALVVTVSIPTPRIPRRTAVPTATRFNPPPGPYVHLVPNSGPPVDQTIQVTGGNLPPNQPARLLWSLGGHAAPLSTNSSTDSRGGLHATFAIPASQPGTYTMTIAVNGLAYATARFLVVSRARISVTATPGAGGEQVRVSGAGFVPRIRLTLIVLSLARGVKPLALGTTRTSSGGRFQFHAVTSKLSPGEYMLQAWSMNTLTAQMAQAFFQVVV